MASWRRRDRLRRYPPLVWVVCALLLGLAVLPSSLNLPQSNPTQTLEFAPVPPEDDDAPPSVTGNLSSLGLGSSASTGSAPGDGGLAPPAEGVSAVGRSPSTKRCVGRPPRQTEDPLSPPCVAHFSGDNFGATYQGVTANEITVLA